VRLARVWFVLPFVLISAACGDAPPPTAPTPAPASFVRMDIDGPLEHYVGEPGEAVQLRAIASFSDGTRPEVTNEATWTVVDSRVVTVSRGVVTGLADGGTIVTASYRGWSSVTNVRVGPVGGRPVPITGVVLDAERGTPVVDAQISENGRLLARTDGNGFFNLGDRSGLFSFWATRFGYEGELVNVGTVSEARRIDVRLKPNPGDYIERRMAGEFTMVEGSTADVRLRIVTRAGGVFDAIVRSSSCGTGGWLAISAQSGEGFVQSSEGSCEGARLRFVVPAPEVLLAIRGYDARDWELTFREPR
jgi:hypothetical protein